MRKELEKRLVDFAIMIFKITKNLEEGQSSSCLINQIIRSSTSAALNYGEAQAAESQKDFIHKSSLVLKELRETQVNLQIIEGSELCLNKEMIKQVLNESGQLVAIFQKTVMTARSKLLNCKKEK